MRYTALGLSSASFVWVVGVVLIYFRTIPQGKVPVKVTALTLKLLLGVVLAGAAIIWGIVTSTAHAMVLGPAIFAIVLAGFILWLLTQRKTPLGDIQVKVGDRLLAFEAMTSDGTNFHSDDLLGKRTLLKFFRGGW